MIDPALLGRIDGLPRTEFSGHAFRHQSPQYPPLSARGARIQGGRWNPAGSFPVLYLGLDQEVIVGEFRRLLDRQARSIADLLPRMLYRYEVQLSNLLDLRSDDALRTVGLSLTDVRSDDLVPCQRVGEAAHYSGREGLLAPSAAVDGVVLALFTDRMEGGSSIVPERVGDWEAPTDVPA